MTAKRCIQALFFICLGNLVVAIGLSLWPTT